MAGPQMVDDARVPPGPPPSTVFGLAAELRRDVLGTYQRLVQRYGDVIRLGFGPRPLRQTFFLLAHPDHVQQLVTTTGTFTKDTPTNEDIAAYSGYGLASTEGQQWRQQRRTVAPLFTRRRTDGYLPVMVEEAQDLARRWTAETAEPTELDVTGAMMEIALRVVARALFGNGVDIAVPVVRRNFPVISDRVLTRALNPLLPPRSWPTPGELRTRRARQALYAVAGEIIEQRRREDQGGDDLISLLLDATDPETGAALSDLEISDQLLIFVLAGHETTAVTLAFTCLLLSQHPQVQQRVREEADTVLGERAPTIENVARLTYTSMVIKEVMRLYPPVYSVMRRAVDDSRIGGYDIPSGSLIVASQWVTHRHPDFWPDPDCFDPDRFTPEAIAARHRYAYFPFLGGPRACIGSHFAMLEATVVIATLVRALQFHRSPEMPQLRTGITLTTSSPVRCVVSRRP